MAKNKSSFVCQNCGAKSPKWVGKCPSCGEWNTYNEEILTEKKAGKKTLSGPKKKSKPTKIVEVGKQDQSRLSLADQELNRVLGGGLVRGSAVLIGGEPGIGKSTLLLQISLTIKGKVLYVSGEESLEQIKLRADRITEDSADCYLLSETDTDQILDSLNELQPDVLIIDSVQTLYSNVLDSPAGSVSQIKQSAAEIIQATKEMGIPAFLIGHITKEGQLAGPKVLEHMVDVVLQFEGDRQHHFRLLRSLKNRFGSTHELGIYDMQADGLREVNNPSNVLLAQRDTDLSGVSVGCSMEGIRPLLIEVQALVSSAAYGTPQRSTTGFDTRRLNMLLAVLEKRCGFRLGAKDVFLNIAGGIKVSDPALDLAVIAAILSSNEDESIDPKTCFFAEVGLSGEIRPVNKIEQRLSEAANMGFEKAYISAFHKKTFAIEKQIKLERVKRIDEFYRNLL